MNKSRELVVICFVVLSLIVSGCGDVKPPHYGVFVKESGTLLELSERQIFSLPIEREINDAEVLSTSQPTIVIWRENTNLNYLKFHKLGQYLHQQTDVKYNATPKENGVIEITPVAPLDDGAYCFVQGDPLAAFLSGWCFKIGSGKKAPSPTNSIIQPVATSETSLSNNIFPSSLVFSPQSPASLKPSEKVNVSFRYSTVENGVLIFVRPMTNGNTSPDFVPHSSPVYSKGEGKGYGYITFSKNNTVHVDQVRIRMYIANTETLLAELYFDVDYSFSP